MKRKTLLEASPISENLAFAFLVHFHENVCIFLKMHVFSSYWHKMHTFPKNAHIFLKMLENVHIFNERPYPVG